MCEEVGWCGVLLWVEIFDIIVVVDCECVWEWDIDVLLNNVGSVEVGVSVEILLELVCVLFEINVFVNLELI